MRLYDSRPHVLGKEIVTYGRHQIANHAFFEIETVEGIDKQTVLGKRARGVGDGFLCVFRIDNKVLIFIPETVIEHLGIEIVDDARMIVALQGKTMERPYGGSSAVSKVRGPLRIIKSVPVHNGSLYFEGQFAFVFITRPEADIAQVLTYSLVDKRTVREFEIGRIEHIFGTESGLHLA